MRTIFGWFPSVSLALVFLAQAVHAGDPEGAQPVMRTRGQTVIWQPGQVPCPPPSGTLIGPSTGMPNVPFPGTAPAPTAPDTGAPAPAISAADTAAPTPGSFEQAQTFGTSGPGTAASHMLGDLLSTGYYRGVIFNPNLVTLQTHVVNRGNVTGVPIVVPVRGRNVVSNIPQFSRGSFKIADNESPNPQTRVFVNYQYFNTIRVPSVDGTINSTTDMHRETLGFEKTLFDGAASIGLRAPIFQTTSSDGGLKASDFGDLTLIAKYALWNNRQTGDLFSLGLAVTVPTGPDFTFVDGSTFHPTLFQPFVGYIWNVDRLYVHGFTGVIVPTDSRDVTLLTNDIGVGYRLLTPDNTDRLVSYLTPTVELHVNTPLNHRGLLNSPVGFPDLVSITSGVHVGIGRNSVFTVGVGVPITGPRLYSVEAIAQFNFRF